MLRWYAERVWKLAALPVALWKMRWRSVKMEDSSSRGANAENLGMVKAAGVDGKIAKQTGLTMILMIVRADVIVRKGQGLTFVKMGESSRWMQTGRSWVS